MRQLHVADEHLTSVTEEVYSILTNCNWNSHTWPLAATLDSTVPGMVDRPSPFLFQPELCLIDEQFSTWVFSWFPEKEGIPQTVPTDNFAKKKNVSNKNPLLSLREQWVKGIIQMVKRKVFPQNKNFLWFWSSPFLCDFSGKYTYIYYI